MHRLRCPQTLREAKPKAGTIRGENGLGHGPQTGVEAQKPQSTTSRVCRPRFALIVFLCFEWTAKSARRKSIGLDEVEENGTWARPIRNDRPPGAGASLRRVLNPMSAAGRTEGRTSSSDQAAKARAAR
jgi:hypothetical protein